VLLVQPQVLLVQPQVLLEKLLALLVQPQVLLEKLLEKYYNRCHIHNHYLNYPSR
jgi:hypothetical protein